MKSLLMKLLLIGITIIALGLRLYALSAPQPFWVDEFSSGTQARIIQEHGLKLIFDSELRKQSGFEHHNIPAHVLIALSFEIFGENEWAARLPFALIGSLIPVLIFVLLAGYGYSTAGIIAALLAAHSHIQVLWSVQARGYMLLQATLLAALYVYHAFITEPHNKRTHFVSLVLISCVGLLSHVTFLFMILALTIHYVWISPRSKNKLMIIGALGVGVVLLMYFTGSIGVFKTFLTQTFTPVNNIWYYHAFLWRHYTLVTFLGVLGLLHMTHKSTKHMSAPLLFMLLYTTFILFIFGHYMTKYLLPIFPLLLAGMGYIVFEITALFTNKNIPRFTIALVLAGFIIGNGNIFISKPKKYLSLNTHFREIANIDYDVVYDRIISKKSPDSALIETWPGRGLWYLGNDFSNLYLYRWENEPGYANGHEKRTRFYTENGVKRISAHIGFVSTSQDLQLIQKLHPTGFLFIDDTSLPESIRLYAEKNFTKELYLDHYPLDENPYSIWPATLYSWGFEDAAKLETKPTQ